MFQWQSIWTMPIPRKHTENIGTQCVLRTVLEVDVSQHQTDASCVGEVFTRPVGGANVGNAFGHHVGIMIDPSKGNFQLLLIRRHDKTALLTQKNKKIDKQMKRILRNPLTICTSTWWWLEVDNSCNERR